jgi:hypothetical protein
MHVLDVTLSIMYLGHHLYTTAHNATNINQTYISAKIVKVVFLLFNSNAMCC